MLEHTIPEYGTITEVPLSTQERDALSAVAPSIRLSPSAGIEGAYDLTAGSHVGAIQLDSLSIIVEPKLPIDRLLFLISYTLGGAEFHARDFGFDPETVLLEAIIPGFAAQIRRAFRQGVLQGYRVTEEALPTVRGRLRFDDQLRNRFGIAPPAEVRFDDFTEDIELNRTIKAALNRLGRLRLRSELARRQLHAFDQILSRVARVDYPRGQVPQPSFDRLNEHYAPAIRLARLVLQATSFEVRHGDVRAAAFLIDMNRVFEDFVIAALRDVLGLGERTFPQGAVGRRLRLDESDRVKLKPDISWWDGQRCTFVGDVKYKKTKDLRVPNADLYQLLAYSIATDLPGGLLIYAAGEEEPGRHTVRNSGKQLDVVALDLAGSPDEVLRQIEDVADLIRAGRGRSRRPQAA
jgi:5-methylcytosine-specific restriction enzyme subunit McrC